MNKILYLVRHCAATGQAADAALTAEGRKQAEDLADFLSPFGIERIVSSPFVRALESIKPLSTRSKVVVESDARLIEAALSAVDHPDWLDKLAATFSDFELRFEGGESSREATERAMAAIEDAVSSEAESIAVVTHGRLMTLILRRFDSKFGFEAWRRLTTPDVFRVAAKDGACRADRIWR